MPAKHTLHVALAEPLVRYVRGKVTDGGSPSASDVVRMALEAMIEREGLGQQRQGAPRPEAERSARG